MLGHSHELLDRLIGRWDLTGQMGETPLRQAVEAKWTLGDLFVEVHCRSVLEAPAGRQQLQDGSWGIYSSSG